MKNKVSILAVLVLCSAFAFPTLLDPSIVVPERYVQWHTALDTMDMEIEFELPDSDKFYHQEIAQVLKDSFKINSPVIPIKVQLMSYLYAQDSYGLSNPQVTVGYGMSKGPKWGYLVLELYHQQFMDYVFHPMTKTFEDQKALFKWLAPTYRDAFVSKADTLQALDMFACYKATVYLSQYNYVTEVARTQLEDENGYATFTSTDWLGRDDDMAKIYALWHRRIAYYEQHQEGFSLSKSQFWAGTAMQVMMDNASTPARKLFGTWKSQYDASTTWTGPSGCELAPKTCN